MPQVNSRQDAALKAPHYAFCSRQMPLSPAYIVWLVVLWHSVLPCAMRQAPAPAVQVQASKAAQTSHPRLKRRLSAAWSFGAAPDTSRGRSPFRRSPLHAQETQQSVSHANHASQRSSTSLHALQ